MLEYLVRSSEATGERPTDGAFVLGVGRLAREEQPIAERLREHVCGAETADLGVAVGASRERITRVIVEVPVVDRIGDGRRARADRRRELGDREREQLRRTAPCEQLGMTSAGPRD